MNLILLIAGLLIGYSINSAQPNKYKVEKCIQEQIDHYGDLCAESRQCDEPGSQYCTDEAANLRGSDSLLIEAHAEGVQCAVESIQMCIESED